MDIERLRVDESLWPDGATHYIIDLDHDIRMPSAFHVEEEDKYRECGSRAYWRKDGLVDLLIIPRPEPRQVEWDGEGLPPVNCECEFRCPGHHGDPEYQWCIFRGKMSDGGYIIEFHHYSAPERVTCGAFDPETTTFRPIRTKGQREREALAELIDEQQMDQGSFCTPQTLAGAILAHYNLEPKQ